VVTPNSRVLSAADDNFAPIYSQWLSNHKEIQTLSQLRDILLPKLISGEIRLKDAEKVVEEVLVDSRIKFTEKPTLIFAEQAL
jgi:type I restriction enzyme S subunit